MRATYYIIIALATAGILFMIYFLDGNQAIVTLITDLGNTAASAGLPRGVVNLVIQPLVFFMSSGTGAVVGGLLWPVAGIWLILLMMVMVFAVIAPTFQTFTV